MKKQAQWIWYPGDFEMMLGLKMWSTRTERGTQITPQLEGGDLLPEYQVP